MKKRLNRNPACAFLAILAQLNIKVCKGPKFRTQMGSRSFKNVVARALQLASAGHERGQLRAVASIVSGFESLDAWREYPKQQGLLCAAVSHQPGHSEKLQTHGDLKGL